MENEKKLDTTVSPEKKLNGTQRIEIMEAQMAKLETLIDTQTKILAEEIDSLRQTIVKLNQRINATIQAGEGGKLSSNAVEDLVIKDDIKKLESGIAMLVKNGILVRDDNMTATEDSFIVGRTLDKDGKILNPRVQFAMNYPEGEEVKESKKYFIGSKVGNIIKATTEGEFDFEVTELYKIVPPEKDIDFSKE